MLCIMQIDVGRFDLLRGYPWFDFVKMIQQRSDFPCLGADVDVVKAEAEDSVARKILAPFINQCICHDSSLGVRLEDGG